MCSDLDLTDPDILAQITEYLSIAASDIQAVMSAAGMCSCSLASWTTAYLMKLNVIDAAVLQNCPCGNKLSQEARAMWLEWINNQFELIRLNKIDLCGGTGTDYPAFGSVEQSLTEWTTAEIVINANARMP